MIPINPKRAENAIEDFKEIKQVLDDLNIEFFLIGGSALAGYRDNQFIAPGSKSVGLGVFETIEGLTSLEKENLVADKLAERGFTVESDIRTIVQVVKRVQTMIYFFAPQKYWFTSYMRNGEDKDRRHFIPQKPRANVYLRFPPRFNQLEKIVVQGMIVKVLKPIGEYLTHTFDDKWKDYNPFQRTKLWAESEPPFDE